ncbi:3'-5' exonuclease [Porphyromonadaceae sp. NP-X]|nr:3'-5' exonuclease [Porphyromonadaceae sp. NP-X]
MYPPKISKEEINQLPVVSFPGEIILVDKPAMVKPAIDELRKNVVVGIDTETKPSFKIGASNKVSLLQLSELERCFLFRLNLIDFPQELQDFLNDSNIKKVGLSLHDDFRLLNKRQNFHPANFVDIQHIAKSYGIMELSLQKIYAIIFGKKISKAQRLSDWEKSQLTEKQLRYAATDAWASLQIYLQLMSEPQLTPKQIEKLILENSPHKQPENSENADKNLTSDAHLEIPS